MKVMKFGGSSVKDAERIRSACAIVRDTHKKDKVVVVFSAMKGITDELIAAAMEAEGGNHTYLDRITTIELRHKEAAQSLLEAEAAGTLISEPLETLFEELKGILHGVELVRECSPRSMDLIMSFGERLSCTLIAAYLNGQGDNAEFVDARECIVTDHRHGSAVVNFELSNPKIKERLHPEQCIPVVTGFIASTTTGVTTTLGRNGSDFTASILGAAIGAGSIEIWTDVDGVLSADPRYVENAFVIDELSIEEAMELSFFSPSRANNPKSTAKEIAKLREPY